MEKCLKSRLIGTLALFSAISVHAADNMKAFPPPETGQVRHVLQLQRQEDEAAYKVELIVGKTVEVDKGNKYFFGGKIKAESITGWGFTRYIVSQLGPMAGTMMAIDPNAPKEQRFVRIGGEPYLIRYNSRIPIVIYVPEGVEARYRLWNVQTEAQPIPHG